MPPLQPAVRVPFIAPPVQQDFGGVLQKYADFINRQIAENGAPLCRTIWWIAQNRRRSAFERTHFVADVHTSCRAFGLRGNGGQQTHNPRRPFASLNPI